MKIAAIIATRGRPHQAVGVIEGIRLMSSGEHEIRYIVACDDDCPADTAGFFSRYGDPSITIECGPRPAGVAACWNRCVCLTDADAIVTLPDDGLICTPLWDKGVNQIFRNHSWVHPDLKIGALNDLANPGQPTLFVIGRAWLERFKLFDERFPFWFSDTAIGEIYSFVTGQGMPILPINFAHRPGHWNPRMREMEIWWALYSATRKERLAMATTAREDLGLPTPPNLPDIIAMWEKRDREGLPASEEIVRQIMNPAPVDDRYLAAKAAALTYIKEHDHENGRLRANT